MPGETKYFHHTLTLSPQSTPPGLSFPAILAYRTYGDPSSPAVFLPSCYGGHIDTTTPFLYDGPHAPFPPSKYFVIVVGLLGGSESSSPSNAPPPYSGPNFPIVTYSDNIRLQHALCQELGVHELLAYIGFSMGGQQSYHMATLYPDFVKHIVCIAGSAKTSAHNWSFLEGPKAALVNSVDYHGGQYKELTGKPCVKGTGAFGRVYSTWALSQEWFRKKCWEKAGPGYPTLEAYLKHEWEDGLAAWDANDLLCLMRTWQVGDITICHPEDGGDLGKTLARITCKVLLMPSRTDTYFPPEDNEAELPHLKNGKFVCIESIWGHMAGGGAGIAEDNQFICEQVGKFTGAR